MALQRCEDCYGVQRPSHAHGITVLGSLSAICALPSALFVRVIFRDVNLGGGGTGPSKIWSGGDTDIDVPPKVSASSVHLCILYCGMML